MLLSRRLSAAGDRLNAAMRIMASLDPDSVLKRGYVRVTGGDGLTLITSAQASKEARLTLHFRDGLLDAVPGGASPPRPPAPRRAAPKPAAHQDDLFG